MGGPTEEVQLDSLKTRDKHGSPTEYPQNTWIWDSRWILLRLPMNQQWIICDYQCDRRWMIYGFLHVFSMEYSVSSKWEAIRAKGMQALPKPEDTIIDHHGKTRAFANSRAQTEDVGRLFN